MTTLEALEKIFPQYATPGDDVIREYCPSSFGFLDLPICDPYKDCERCWKEDIFIGGPSTGDDFTANFYQLLALRTMKPDMKVIDQLSEGLMGLAGEGGEAIDILKKHKFQGHELDRGEIALELGDIAWYLAEAANAIGYSLSEIFRMNIEKLRKRYPDGFSTEDSIKRVDEEESNG